MQLEDAETQRRLLHAARETAARAGDAVMAVYETSFSVERKADASPLTAADRASHDIILAELAALHPHLPVLSEESPAGDLEHRRSWRRYWLVDPLDGTKEFVKRNDEFTVNIALIVDGRPVLGVVGAPACDIEYFGAAALGAWRRRGDTAPEQVHTALHRSGPVRVLGSRSHPSRALTAYLERLGPYELLSIGSSLKICLVADGQADVYPRFGPTSEWDTAAGQAVLESAGGSVIDLQGRELRYNSKDSLLNPQFLAIGDSSRDWLAAVP